MPLWKRLVIISASAGAGLAFMLALIIGGLLWYDSRPKQPKPWNTGAIKATYDVVAAEGDNSHLVFYYILENTTDSDYRLEESSTATIMGRLRKQNSLTQPLDKELQIKYPVFIPAKQRGRYSISIPSYKYPGGRLKDDASKDERQAYRKEISGYVNEKLSNLDGFALFDDSRRYQINFLKGW